MKRSILLGLLSGICSFLHAQSHPDPANINDPTNLRSTRPIESRQVLPRNEIPGTLRKTGDDEILPAFSPEPENDGSRNAPDTAFIRFPKKPGDKDVLTPVQPPPTSGRKAADTLEYLPGRTGGSLPANSPENK
jgi:hypothetical protein